jgi:hypothetical protein
MRAECRTTRRSLSCSPLRSPFQSRLLACVWTLCLVAAGTPTIFDSSTPASAESRSAPQYVRVPNRASTGYPIVCRGGGKLHFTYSPFSSLSSEPQIWIRFERGAAPVGANRESIGSLGPGQCSWTDRALSADEPDVLVLTTPVFLARQFSIQWQNGQVAGISSELDYLTRLQRPEGVQTFRVSNNGRGAFLVSMVQ